MSILNNIEALDCLLRTVTAARCTKWFWSDYANDDSWRNRRIPRISQSSNYWDFAKTSGVMLSSWDWWVGECPCLHFSLPLLTLLPLATNTQSGIKAYIEGDFMISISLQHGLDLLQLHGLRIFHSYISSIIDGK